MYKLYKEKQITYYKYQSWTQPVFSSNTLTKDSVWYQLTASREQASSVMAYNAFDGDTTTNQQCWWTGKVSVTEDNPAWICLECSNKLKLTSVAIMNEKYQPENPKSGYIQASHDGINWKNVGTFTGTNTASYVTTVPLSVTEGYRFYRVYFTATWGEGVSIQEITYTGQIAKEVTSSSYDYSEVKAVYKAVKEIPKMNVEVVGNPTIKDGIISGFSSGNYALVPGVPSNITSYEMVARFTTASLNSVQMGILANSNTNRATPQIVISAGNNLCFDHPKDANTWVSSGAVLALTANTTYWAKMAWDGNTVSCYYKSPTDTDWVLAYSSACTTVSWIEQLGIGIDGTSLPFNGSIDLKECYVKINGQMWWSGTKGLAICKAYKGD